MPSRQNDLAQIAALGAALTGSGRSGGDSSGMDVVRTLLSSARSAASGRTSDDYDQNMQTRKEQFLETAASKKGDDYLRSTRTAPLSEYEIKAGWEIPAVLEQSLNSDLPGEIKALVMSNVYDTATGRYLLIPQGSRLVGKYDSHIAYGQDGLQVVWNRIIFPDASSVDLAGMEGLDSQGNAGLRHKVDRHYKRLFGFAALTSLFTAAFEVSQRRNQSVLTYPNPSDTAAAAVGREMSQTGAMITRRNLNVQPTIKVPVGLQVHGQGEPRHFVRRTVRGVDARSSGSAARPRAPATVRILEPETPYGSIDSMLSGFGSRPADTSDAAGCS